MLADVAIVSANLLESDPDDMARGEADITLSGGNIVYERVYER